MKYFENGSNYMRMMQHEIKYNLMSSIKDSVQQISTAMYSILEDCSHLDSKVSDAADLKPVEEIEPLATNAEEPVAKLQTRPVFTEEPVRVQTRQTFLEEISTKGQVRLKFGSCNAAISCMTLKCKDFCTLSVSVT